MSTLPPPPPPPSDDRPATTTPPARAPLGSTPPPAPTAGGTTRTYPQGNGSTILGLLVALVVFGALAYAITMGVIPMERRAALVPLVPVLVLTGWVLLWAYILFRSVVLKVTIDDEAIRLHRMFGHVTSFARSQYTFSPRIVRHMRGNIERYRTFDLKAQKHGKKTTETMHTFTKMSEQEFLAMAATVQ